MNTNTILYKKLEPIQIAFIKTRIENRDQLTPIFDRLGAICGDAIAGNPMVIFHGGAVKEGFLIEAAYPVICLIEHDDIQTRMLEAAPALTMQHFGKHQTIRETVLKIYEYIGTHAWTTSLFRREIYQSINPANPEANITEVQIILHEWDQLLAEGAENILGTEARQQIMQGIEKITPDSSFEDYTDWILGAIDRLDTITNDNQKKCQIISHCAHVFPQERIDHLRAIYEKGTVDDVLMDMYTDDFWYEKPVRRGNVSYMRKNPYDPEGYENAVSPAERRKAYCHCAFVHPYLDQIPSKLSPTFCFCGAGWYTRLWEGIFGQPVKIEHVETLLRGNDQCTLTITLPIKLDGEFPSQKDLS